MNLDLNGDGIVNYDDLLLRPIKPIDDTPETFATFYKYIRT